MCGICGIISHTPQTDARAKFEPSLKAMNAELVHRGPNSEGYFSDSVVTAGMRRLSIIDLDSGSQPLYNEDRSISLIANGEIYNFVELREELQQKGHTFSTGSDCETIIHAYEEYGEEKFLEHLRGMFGFCLRDAKNNKVILARDRLGEKPLYIYETKEALYFSSELKSVIESIPLTERAIDQTSLYALFHYGYVPEPRCLIQGIRKLPPAHVLSINTKTNSATEKQYWTLEDSKPIQEPVQEIRKSLEEIESIITRSDVPVGVALSGGIDSSVVATLAARNGDKKLHAFSVGYPGYPEHDERKQAEKLAHDLGLTFHNIEIYEKDFIKDFSEMIYSMDEPVADIAAYGYYAISRKAREQNVPVLLAGFGGDELFWGYPWVAQAARLNALKHGSFMDRLTLAVKLKKEFWRDGVRRPFFIKRMLWKMLFSEKPIFYELTPLWRYIKRHEKKIFNKNFVKKVDTNIFDEVENSSEKSNAGLAMTFMLCKTWLTSNCLNLGDRMSMAHSVELRLPLIDYRLCEVAAGIRKSHPRDFDLGHKHWLIEAVKDLIPKEILERKKRGFTPPTKLWVDAAITQHRALITNGYLVKNSIIQKEFIENALQNPDHHRKFLYIVLVFEIWGTMYLP